MSYTYFYLASLLQLRTVWYHIILKLEQTNIHGIFDFIFLVRGINTHHNRVEKDNRGFLEVASGNRWIVTSNTRDTPRGQKSRMVLTQDSGAPIEYREDHRTRNMQELTTEKEDQTKRVP